MEIILFENIPLFFTILIDFIMLVRNFAITCFSLNVFVITCNYHFHSYRLNINNFLGKYTHANLKRTKNLGI